MISARSERGGTELSPEAWLVLLLVRTGGLRVGFESWRQERGRRESEETGSQMEFMELIRSVSLIEQKQRAKKYSNWFVRRLTEPLLTNNYFQRGAPSFSAAALGCANISAAAVTHIHLQLRCCKQSRTCRSKCHTNTGNYKLIMASASKPSSLRKLTFLLLRVEFGTAKNPSTCLLMKCAFYLDLRVKFHFLSFKSASDKTFFICFNC